MALHMRKKSMALNDPEHSKRLCNYREQQVGLFCFISINIFEHFGANQDAKHGMYIFRNRANYRA